MGTDRRAQLVDVVTTELKDGAKPDRHEIDYSAPPTRIWLSKHIMWALNNNRKVEIVPVEFD